MKKTGLFFGSFNPIHIGHLIIAEYMLSMANLDEVWLVVSPQNPFKNNDELFPDTDRLEMVKLATRNNPRLKVCDVEFSLPKPSYTIQTLTWLKQNYPDREFALIMGSDNLVHFPKWKEAEKILSLAKLHVYRRFGYEHKDLETNKRIVMYEAPVLHISATFVRELMHSGRSIRYLVPDEIITYLKDHFQYTETI